MSMELATIEKTSVALTARALAIQVRDQSSHDEAAELYIGLGELEKQICAVHDPAIALAHASHKGAIAAKAVHFDPVSGARKIIKPKITRWEQEQEDIRRDLERKAQEEARRREEEARLALAVEAESANATPEVIEEIMSTPMQIVTPVVAPTYAKTKGFTSRANYRAEVVNMRELCRAIADGKQPVSLVEATAALNGLARAMKEQFNVPGCRVVKEQV
jgi:hypothetical protein